MSDRQSDFIEQLFDTISNDPALPSELKISLLRLQLPILKISQSDTHFISNDKHPARRTIFIIKRLASHAKQDPSLITKIDLILSELTKSSLSSNNFSQINQRLELLAQNIDSTSPQQNNTNKMTDDQIKLHFNKKLKLCIQGHTIPAACQTLMLKLWPNALFYLLKTHGEKSQHWLNAINMYIELLDSIQPLDNIDQYRDIKDRFMSLARSNNNMLLLYHQESKVEPVIKSLISHYNHLLGRETQANSNDKTPGTLEKISSLPPNIKPGIWCEIYIDDITPARRLRLSVININNGMLVFVNRKGIKKVEKDALEFSRELKRGLSKVYNHDTLFGKTTSENKYQKIG